MRRWTWIAFGALVGVLGSSTTGLAQFAQPQPPIRPPVSPFINLARGGNPGINYIGIIRPQIQQYNALNQLQAGVANNQQQIAAEQQDLNGIAPTGSMRGAFMTQSRYFMTNGQGLGGMGGFRSPQQQRLQNITQNLPQAQVGRSSGQAGFRR